MARHHVAVVALSRAKYRHSQSWEMPSQVLDEDLAEGGVQWRELELSHIDGTLFDVTAQRAVMQESLDLRLLAKSMVPTQTSQLLMIRCASKTEAGVAALVLAGLFGRHGAEAEAFFLDYVQDWGIELQTAIDMVKQCPQRRTLFCVFCYQLTILRFWFPRAVSSVSYLACFAEASIREQVDHRWAAWPWDRAWPDGVRVRDRLAVSLVRGLGHGATRVEPINTKNNRTEAA